MDDFDEFLPPPPRHTMDCAPLFVSLFLMLLVFFVILNHMSQPSYERTKNAAVSLKEAFDQGSINKPAHPEFEMPEFSTQAKFQDFYHDIRDAVKGVTDLKEGPPTRYGRIMLADVPISSLFQKDSAEFIDPHTLLLDNIAKSVLRWQETSRILVTPTLHYAAPLSDSKTPEMALGRARLIALTESLKQLGIPMNLLNVALAPGDTRSLQFTFYLIPNSAIKPVSADVQ